MPCIAGGFTLYDLTSAAFFLQQSAFHSDQFTFSYHDATRQTLACQGLPVGSLTSVLAGTEIQQKGGP